MKKILYLFPMFAMLAAACNNQPVPVYNNIPVVKTPIATPTATTTQTKLTNEIKLTGTIEAVKNEQPYDGLLSVEVSGKWIAISGGNMPTTGNNGLIIGLDVSQTEKLVGKKVEVYASKVTEQDNTHFTILGSSKYYIKLLQ